MVASLIPPCSEEPAPTLPQADPDTLAERFGIQETHLFVEPELELKGIVAIHSTRLGPALGGTRYSGTSVADMDAVARRTRHVAGTSALGDPAPYAARGVQRAIEGALSFRFGRSSVADTWVAIQGVGHVGYELARQLSERGARITVADPHGERAARCARDFGAEVVAPDAIYDAAADVFSPCALGGTINARTLERLKVAIIAGSANNQLEHDGCARLAHDKGILYAPDYAANGGGLMLAAGLARAELPGRVDGIYDLLLDVFSVARSAHTSPLTVANRHAEAVLNGAKS